MTTINLLDPSQRQALDGVVNSKEDVTVIYGPPGTGKSHLILSLLFELAVKGKKVLFVSQNTEALEVIIRMYRKLDRELRIGNESLSFLDFCWCLNSPEQKKVTYIRRQKNRIMTKKIGTLPTANEEIDDEPPYDLTYRMLDRVENLAAEPEKIGFDELLMSSLKNVRRTDMLKDIVRKVSDQSFRKALNLLNNFSDEENYFAELNNPKDALKYLNPSNFAFTLNEAQIATEDVCAAAKDVMKSHGMVANKNLAVLDYVEYVQQVAEYAKVVDVNYFADAGKTIEEVCEKAKERLEIENELKDVAGLKGVEGVAGSLLQEVEDVGILALEDLAAFKKYNKFLGLAKEKVGGFLEKREVDGDTKLGNLYSCVFSKINLRGLPNNSQNDFKQLDGKGIERLIRILEEYNEKNKFARKLYLRKIPDEFSQIIGTKENIEKYSERLDFLNFLAKCLEGTERTVGDIIKNREKAKNSIFTPLEMDDYEENSEEYAELCNDALMLLNLKVKNIRKYSLKQIDEVLERQIEQMTAATRIITKNAQNNFETMREAIEAINENVHNLEITKRQKELDEQIGPYLTDKEKIEDGCRRMVEVAAEKIALEELLKNIKVESVKKNGGIDAEQYEKMQAAVRKAQKAEMFSEAFFVVREGEDLIIWMNRIKTLLDFNDLEKFDAFLSQNRFILELKEALSSDNEWIIDQYLKNDELSFDEFKEHMTKDIVETIYENAPAEVRRKAGWGYFRKFKKNHRNLQLRAYLEGLTKLQLNYEDPAKVLTAISNWKTARTNIDRIRRNSQMIVDAYPVTIATPADVSKYLSSKKGYFDYVIFDEASQLLPGQALPSIYRAKRAVIVGDPHQMPPTMSIGMMADDGEAEEMLDDDEQSILDLAINLQMDATYHLKVHYRSESNSLFEPSRKAIYAEDGVQPIFEAESNKMPIYIKDELGEDNEKNFAVLAQRMEYYLEQEPESTFCVLFPRTIKGGLYDFKKYIEESGDRKIADLYEKDRLLVSTVTNCQGIEGDHTILYLPVYRSPKAMWFFKETAGAYKRLNVSVTRQRQTLDIIMGDPRNKWIRVCQDFLDSNSCGPNQQKSAEILNTLLTNAGKKIDEEYLERSLGPNADNIDSPLTQELYDRLQEYYDKRLGKDLKIWCEVGWNMLIPDAEGRRKNELNVGYRIDIGIYSIRHRKFVLGIEMDGATYHSGFRKEFSDLQRQEVLEKKGWKLYRIWSTDWLNDTEGEFRDLVETIDKCLAEEVEEDVADDRGWGDDDEGLVAGEEGGDADADADADTDADAGDFNDGADAGEDAEEEGDLTNEVVVRKRPEDSSLTREFEKEFAGVLKKCAKSGKSILMKYSNKELSDDKKEATPYQEMYVKEVDEKFGFFLASFDKSSSPYRIKIESVFEYVEPGEG